MVDRTSPLGEQWRGRRRIFGPAEERRRAAGILGSEELEQILFCDGPGELRPYVYRVSTLTGLSALIASFGLLQSSTAVVIGAMLVSPLMQPIIGLAAALVRLEGRRQLVSLGLVLLAAVESVLVAVLVAWLVPTFRSVTITPEILLRTSPGILDLGIAVAAGAAGAYVTVHSRAAGALPGAAIAVALMPPLAALGILIERGNYHFAAGALLLFATNLFGIVLASAIVLSPSWLGLVPVRRWRNRAALLVPLVVALLLAIPLARFTASSYQRAKDEAIIRSVVVPPLRAQGLGIQALNLASQDGILVASLDVAGPSRPLGTSDLSSALADRLGHPVTVILRWTKRDELTALSSPRLG